MSSPAIQFKGKGWYVTDYARKQPETEKTDAAAAGDKEKAGEKARQDRPGGEKSAAVNSASADSSSSGSAAAVPANPASKDS